MNLSQAASTASVEIGQAGDVTSKNSLFARFHNDRIDVISISVQLLMREVFRT
jgi:hypothetical protein